MAETGTTISSLDQLTTAFPEARRGGLLDRLASKHVSLIAVSPLVILSTSGPDGIDCSPRGDLPGFVRVLDDRTLMLPDRGRNMRLDALCNIVGDDRIGLLFIVPGSGATLRVNGRARISTDPEVLRSFEVGGELPRTVIVVTIASLLCWSSQAMDRAALWDAKTYVDPSMFPRHGPEPDAADADPLD